MRHFGPKAFNILVICCQVWQRWRLPIPVFPLLWLRPGGGGLRALLLRPRSEIRTLFQRIYNASKRCLSARLKYKLLPHQGRLWWGLLFNRLSKMCYLWLSGGTWYCFPDIGLNQPVPTGTKWALRLFFRQFTNFLGSDVSGNVQARVCITSARLASGARSQARQGEGKGTQTEQSLKT